VRESSMLSERALRPSCLETEWRAFVRGSSAEHVIVNTDRGAARARVDRFLMSPQLSL